MNVFNSMIENIINERKFFSLKIALIFIGFLFIIILTIQRLGYRIIYQPTPSMPSGWYFLRPVHHIHRGDMIVFYPPKAFVEFAKKHRWIPQSGLLMKYAAAIPGDWVCKREGYVWINHRKIASVYRYYAPHKLLPNKPFCQRLKANQFLFLSNRVSHSLDGRYFGPVHQRSIVGKVVALGDEL